MAAYMATYIFFPNLNLCPLENPTPTMWATGPGVLEMDGDLTSSKASE